MVDLFGSDADSDNDRVLVGEYHGQEAEAEEEEEEEEEDPFNGEAPNCYGIPLHRLPCLYASRPALSTMPTLC